MTKKKDKITKKDPKKELSGWIDYKNKVNNNEKKRVSASLTKLQAERRHALLTRLGFIILFSLNNDKYYFLSVIIINLYILYNNFNKECLKK